MSSGGEKDRVRGALKEGRRNEEGLAECRRAVGSRTRERINADLI